MPARDAAHAFLKFQRSARITIGLMLMLLLPQSSSATIIFVVFENGYGELARLVVLWKAIPIRKFNRGILFDVGSAADDDIAASGLMIPSRVLGAQPSSYYLVGTDLESMATLARDPTQLHLARRQRLENRHELLQTWAQRVIASRSPDETPILFVNTRGLYESAFNALDPMLRGFTTFAHMAPVLRVRDLVLLARTEVVPAPMPYLQLIAQEMGIPDEIRHHAAALHQRDRLVAAVGWSPSPELPLPIRSPAGRIIGLITGYLANPAILALDAPGFILLYQLLSQSLRPLWEAQWRQPMLWQRDTAVAPWVQAQYADAWQLNLLPGSAGIRSPGALHRMHSGR